ncbi:putative zinc-binding dehydrogenase protein [Lasiodiplodia theobromae]|nr:putative zinc-binding dehydrogenase protein [Lasiodiplodia theobromae]
MIGQAEVRARSWGAYANLKRDLTIADLKPNATATASHDAASRPVTRAPFQGLKEGGSVAVNTPPSSSSSSVYEQASPRPDIPTTQTVLMLYQPRTRYALTPKHETPSLHFDDEVLIKVKAIGLNPIDWKAPDFGFGIPTLPYISGRDYVGTIVHAHPSSPHQPRSTASSSSSSASTTSSSDDDNNQQGPLYLAVSTDYRDTRKAAFQEYAIAHTHTICRLPASLPAASGASLGVAFVAAALTLGICFGIDFSRPPSPSSSSSSSSSATQPFVRGPDYLTLLNSIPASRIPADVLAEAHGSIPERERAGAGDWLALWGGSSTTALCALQLARLAGLRVVAVGDAAKHGARPVATSVDLWVDSHDPQRAAEVVRGVTGGACRFGVDFVGRETAGRLAGVLGGGEGEGGEKRQANLVGLASNPKGVEEGVRVHSVPIKLFHEVPEVGRATMEWLERLLEGGLLTPPEVVVEKGGLAGVNAALDRMRRGEISGRRLAVELD